MLFHKMLASIIINTVGIIILVNNVRTENNENMTIKYQETLTTGQKTREHKRFGEQLVPRQKYDTNQIDSLFQLYKETNILDKNEEKKNYDAFSDNIRKMNFLIDFYGTAHFSINAYTHLTFEEFTKLCTGFNSTGLTDDGVILFNRSIVQELPPVIDWSDEILNEYHQDTKCKTSYVFSALSNIEAQYVALTGQAKSGTLSIRQPFECEKQGSCEYGGVPHYVFQALQDTGGISLMHMYPYMDPDYVKGECQTAGKDVVLDIEHYTRLKVEKEEDLMYVLAYYGPVVTTIFASESIRHYSGGVLDPGDCAENATNQPVLLDGYGVDSRNNLPYWHVKSSWRGWGDLGHIRLIRGKGFVCNLGREYIVTATVRPHREISYVTQNLIKTVTTELPPEKRSIFRKKYEENSEIESTNASVVKKTTQPFLREVRTQGMFEEFGFIP